MGKQASSDEPATESPSQFNVLIDGYQRFRTGAYQEQRLRYDQLAQGQSPKVMVVACSDSRVDPTRVFDSGPGEMFVFRNIANLIPPHDEIHGQSSVAAALEYAVCVLQVEHIVIFGHARCGGIAASLAGEFDAADSTSGKHIHVWMEMIAPARDSVRKAAALSPDIDQQRALEHAAVRLSLKNLRTYPFVADAEAAGKVALHGAIFDIADGGLRILEAGTDQFTTVPINL